MDKSSQLLLRHLSDLADDAAYRGGCTFTDFLNLNEQTIFIENRADFSHVRCAFNGGYESAERRMIKFFSDSEGETECETPFPIQCVRIEAVSEKFSDQLTHRDFLGAVLNLGIDRGKTGDILVRDNTAYLLATETMAPFICENLEQVRHTRVRASLCALPQTVAEPAFRTKQGSVTSVRIDSLVALAFNLSRTSAARYISQGLVFINGRMVTSNSAVPRDGDVISVRTLGRFKLETTDRRSKKDKLIVRTHIYI